VTDPAIVAVILAGGHSRRMGRDKASLAWDGEPMLRRVYTAARTIAPHTFVMSAWNERYRDRDDLDLSGCRWIGDPNPGAGPLVALCGAIDDLAARSVPHDWLLLLACDLPSLDRDRLADLCDRAASRPRSTLAIAPRTDRGWEPLCALYRPAARASLADFLAAGGRSFQAWLTKLAAIEAIEAVEVAAADRAWLRNCNTPEDLSPDRAES